MTTNAVQLLQENPRKFWAHAVRILIERGWSPPPPDERIVDELLLAMANVPALTIADLDDVDPGQLANLTAREREVAGMLPFGLSNADIGRRLGLAEGTVKFHLSNVYRKLGVTSRAAVVAIVLGAAE